ncbi:MAG TPA: hypothetical protein VNR39_05265 [Pseudolabrys sp.]|nr:hypothetical protein [Pseudolabrys sp.]
MTSRKRLLLLVTTAFGAAALLCPLGGSTRGPAALGPLASSAPPLFDAPGNAPAGDNAAMNALHREATGALGQLQGRPAP